MPPTPTVLEPPSQGPELLLPAPEAESDALSPPKKKPATQSPSSLSALTDAHVYPPMHHGPTGSQASSSSANNQIKRGRDLTQTRATTTTVDPPELSPSAATARFIRANFAQSQTDSPLQDRSSVKKAKPSDSEIDEDNAIPQDLNEQFESLADIRIEPPAFPQ